MVTQVVILTKGTISPASVEKESLGSKWTVNPTSGVFVLRGRSSKDRNVHAFTSVFEPKAVNI